MGNIQIGITMGNIQTGIGVKARLSFGNTGKKRGENEMRYRLFALRSIIISALLVCLMVVSYV